MCVVWRVSLAVFSAQRLYLPRFYSVCLLFASVEGYFVSLFVFQQKVGHRGGRAANKKIIRGVKISRGIATNGALPQWGQQFYAQQNGSLGNLTHWIVMACDRWLRTKAARGGLNRTNLAISHSTSAEETRLAIAQANYVLIGRSFGTHRANFK